MANTPVLPGDDCLYAADKNNDFRYFFQHHIANKLKSQDPEALAAISLLEEVIRATKRESAKEQRKAF